MILVNCHHTATGRHAATLVHLGTIGADALHTRTKLVVAWLLRCSCDCDRAQGSQASVIILQDAAVLLDDIVDGIMLVD